ncbi:hypothetical protein MTR67_031115 [Solanum verrucosum]|uniref:Integrase zinc-binding domain-containing protein n=1 Tax=Solanum verrucosum TaxID=315347 RepID=A0AAF0ZFJ3_SOLVR|nr:hypothetical protein MTR67_031115 [Solanum verrucosum]
MYHDLPEVNWWNGMEKDIAGFIAMCSNCEQVKAENLRLGGLSQDIDIPTWKVGGCKYGLCCWVSPYSKAT